jgi:hypothetical protein
MRYVSLSFVRNLLKTEVDRTGIRVPDSDLRKAAIDIWETL